MGSAGRTAVARTIVSGRLGRSGLRITPIGRVESPLTDCATAPKQGHEGAPDAWLVFVPDVLDGLQDLHGGDRVIVLTWLHHARRDVLRFHPRDDVAQPEKGMFSTRSADRPNPIGLHPVEVLSVDGLRVRVANLEAVHGTPIVDVKPLLAEAGRSRAVSERKTAGGPGHGRRRAHTDE